MGELRPRERLRKNPSELCDYGREESLRETSNKLLREILNQTIIRANKNIEEQEVVMSLTKTNSKVHEPKSYDKAIDDPIYGRHWRKGIKEELQNLKSHQTWEYGKLPQGQKAIESKWVFKVKYQPNRSVARFMTRLIAQGFSQVQGVDFCETFAPIVRRESLQIYLALCLMFHLIIYQVDIVGAYLESLLDDYKFPIFMKLPPKMY